MNPSTNPTASFDLVIEGMSCASCVGRVEKALSGVSGVSGVSLNLATEKAHVIADKGTQVNDLKAAVEKAGYVLV